MKTIKKQKLYVWKIFYRDNIQWKIFINRETKGTKLMNWIKDFAWQKTETNNKSE